jgi:hypothetical protein
VKGEMEMKDEPLRMGFGGVEHLYFYFLLSFTAT